MYWKDGKLIIDEIKALTPKPERSCLAIVDQRTVGGNLLGNLLGLLLPGVVGGVGGFVCRCHVYVGVTVYSD